MIPQQIDYKKIPIRGVQTIVSGLFYLVALFSVCVTADPAKFGSYGVITGFHALFWGWILVFVWQFAWVANIFLFFAVLFAWQGKRRESAKYAAFALAIAMETLLLGKPGLGFFCWTGSMAIWIFNFAIPDAQPPLTESARANDPSTSSPTDGT